jgi:hypothetical protein
MERFVYVHEFCHAVEDGHFDLARLSKTAMGDFDRNQALTCLVEGSAVLVGLDGLFAELPVNTATPLGGLIVELMGRLDTSETVEQEMGDCPAFLGGALVRPYLDGGVFVNRIRREAGGGGANAVFQDGVPVTTAEILYPERRYLRPFQPVDVKLSSDVVACTPARFSSISTNRLGVMGMALWLGEKTPGTARDFWFLKGWMGDRLFFVLDGGGRVMQTVWFSCWDRRTCAWAFARRARRRLSHTFGETPWSVQQTGRRVAIVWSGHEGGGGLSVPDCERLAKLALVSADVGDDGTIWDECVEAVNEWPWPVRFPWYPGHSGGVEVLGGHGADVCKGSDFMRASLAAGLLARVESNPDRHYYGLAGGLVRHVRDARSRFTFWKVPLVASWFSRQEEDGSRNYRWRVLWGLAGYGDETSAHFLFMPVWKAETRSGLQ